MTEHRDPELAELLAALEVPEHRTGFWAELEAELAAEPVPMARARRRRPRQRPTGRLLLAAAVLVLVAGIAAVVATRGTTTRDDDGEFVLTAAVVADRVTDRLANLQTLSGTLEVVDAGQPPRVHRFWRASDGSSRIEYPDGEVTVYDASAGTLTTSMLAQTGVPVGPPDVGAFGFGLLEEDVVTALQAARTIPDATVREDVVDGRPVWIVTTPVQPNLLADGSVDRLELVVDQELIVPVRVTMFGGGSVLQESRFTDLVVDGVVPEGTFTAEPPAGVEVTDLGFRRVGSPEEAATNAGYPAPVPSAVPDGFELTAVAWAPEAFPTGPEGGNPPSVDVVTLLYTRGFEWFTVSTRRADVAGFDPIWDDPFGQEGIPREPEQVELGAGRFAGVTVDVSVTRPVVPHLWGIGDGLVFTVAGNLTTDELVAVADSIA